MYLTVCEESNKLQGRALICAFISTAIGGDFWLLPELILGPVARADLCEAQT